MGDPDMFQQQLLDMLNSPVSLSSSFDSSNDSSVPSLSSSDGSSPPDDIQDPMLLYINNLLMDEDIDNVNSTPRDSIAYQTTVKNFSDILNDTTEHVSSENFNYGEGFMVSEHEFHSLSTAEGIDKQDVCQMREGLLRTVSQISPMKPSQTKFRLQQEPESLVLQNTNGNSKHYVSSESFKQQLSNESLNQKILCGTLRSQVSNESLNQQILHASSKPQVSNRLMQHPANSPSTGFMLTSSRSTSQGQKMSFNNRPVSTDSARLKRPSPEESNSNENGTDNSQEDSVSFVQNENLKAEKYAQAINEGLTEIVEKLKKMGPRTTVVPKSRKPNGGKLATTVDLKNMLLSCAQAVGDGNTRRANEVLKEIRQEATPYGDDLQRLAHYFAEGLVARITGTGAIVYSALSNNLPSTSKMLKAHRMFADLSPCHKISNIFANKAIVEAAKDASRLHIIDYGIWYGIQWPSLISALAERKGGPPSLRMTMIEFPDPGNNPAGRVEWTGKRLSEYAKAYGVPFEYQAIADKWENITASSVGLRNGEILIVTSMFRLHQVLDESVMPSDPRTTTLKNILEMNPKLFVHGVVNGSYTSPFFMSRFREALTSFSSYFDMMEALAPSNSQERLMIDRALIGRLIINIVACEGHERVERPATYKQWQSRMESVGFVQMCLDEKMVKDYQDIARLHYNKNFNIDTDGNWMLVSWKGKVNHAMKLWRPG